MADDGVAARIELREETSADVPAIHALNAAAFETPAEANLVDALRDAGALTLSLVAERDGAIVGHIAFSPVTITGADGAAPAHQRAGIGGQLIAEGLRRLAAAGHHVCVVLGHAEYYPRHGVAASNPTCGRVQ